MQNEEQRILKSIRQQVQTLFDGKQKDTLPYHNLEQTKYLVKAVTRMADYYQLGIDDRFKLQAAAWFSYAGWLEDPDDPETAGAGMAQDFLATKKMDAAVIDQIGALILITKMPQHPSDLLGEIMCDGKFYYWGKKSFSKRSRLLRRESGGINKKDWLSENVRSMETYHYFTEYGRSLLEPEKSKNLARLKTRLESAERIGERQDKGTETLFRITSSNNQRLSVMADQKAHLLITVNSIILSAIISLVLRRLDKFGFLLYPTVLLSSVCLAAMTLAILTTRPSIPSGKFNAGDLDAKKVNLLFFGNFYKMSLKAYMDGMIRVMDDSDYLYRTLIMDLYGQGIVLGKKYGFLRIAYSIFMFGLILSVLAFIIASIVHHENLPIAAR